MTAACAACASSLAPRAAAAALADFGERISASSGKALSEMNVMIRNALE